MIRARAAVFLLAVWASATACEKLVGIHEPEPGRLDGGGCEAAGDTDQDGTPDCMDGCPLDPNKTEPGICGCGIGDVDSDKDGLRDCDDGCPRDSTRDKAGACGCGVPDDQPLCLVHRYTFDGAKGSTTVADSIGAANGVVVRASLSGDGTLTLQGGTTNDFVTLPSGIISAVGDSVTVEAWVTATASSPAAWQRIFDFGDNSDHKAGEQGPLGINYLYLTPFGPKLMQTVLSTTSYAGERKAGATVPFPTNTTTAEHVAVVVDARNDVILLYQDGMLQGNGPLQKLRLSFLNDVNNWLGRSQYAADPGFSGKFVELRIYSVARTAAQIAADKAAGPDALPAL